MKGYNTYFDIVIYNKYIVLHDTIIGEISVGNTKIHGIVNCTSNLLTGIINITYDKTICNPSENENT